MSGEPTYIKQYTITDHDYGSCDVYHMRAGGYEPKHFHDGVEIVYVIKGSCKTHKERQVYVYQKGEVHEVLNDSDNELVFVCLTIPPESERNTHYI